jgi:hypothetical protein
MERALQCLPDGSGYHWSPLPRFIGLLSGDLTRSARMGDGACTAIASLTVRVTDDDGWWPLAMQW